MALARDPSCVWWRTVCGTRYTACVSWRPVCRTRRPADSGTVRLVFLHEIL